MKSINIIVIDICNSDAQRVPLENWIFLSLQLNSSAWNSQKLSSNFQKLLQPTSSQSSCFLSPSVCSALGSRHTCSPHITLTVLTPIRPDSEPRPLIFPMENQVTSSILLFWVFKWRLVWEMLRDWMQGTQPAISSHATLPFLSFPLLVSYSTSRKLSLLPIFKVPVDHLPQETFQKVSHLWMWVAHWNKLSRQQWGGYNSRWLVASASTPWPRTNSHQLHYTLPNKFGRASFGSLPVCTVAWICIEV